MRRPKLSIPHPTHAKISDLSERDLKILVKLLEDI